MRSVSDILNELSERDLLELALTISREHHVLLDEMLGRGRTSEMTAARHAFWFHLRGLNFSYPRIAALCGVDHTTVMYGVRRWRDVVEGAAEAAGQRVAPIAKTTLRLVDPEDDLSAKAVSR